MNRRGFLKTLGLVPFVVRAQPKSLSVEDITKASDDAHLYGRSLLAHKDLEEKQKRWNEWYSAYVNWKGGVARR